MYYKSLFVRRPVPSPKKFCRRTGEGVSCPSYCTPEHTGALEIALSDGRL